MKRITAAALLFQGCASFQSPVFDTEPTRAGFVVTKPPMQVSFRGDVTPEMVAFTNDVIKELSKIPYRNYRFNENHNVRLNSIDGKSDAVTIILKENATLGTSSSESNTSQ